jgi:phenylacetate-coenzyme A ligase PaaK-like adenylate-forming protein
MSAPVVEILVCPRVELVEPASIARREGKGARAVDERVQ